MKLSELHASEEEYLKDRIAQLEAWKESSLVLINSIRLQEVGKELGLKLGTDIGPEILPGILKLKEGSKMSVLVEYCIPIPDYASAYGTMLLSRVPCVGEMVTVRDEKKAREVRSVFHREVVEDKPVAFIELSF